MSDQLPPPPPPPPPPPSSWGGPGVPGAPQPGGWMGPGEERTWGAAAHWSALVAAVVGLSFMGPLVVLLVKGGQSPHVRRQAVESLNFQLSILIYALVSAVLILALVGFLLLPLVGLLWLVFTIMGSIRSADGRDYRYPLTLRMVR